jgi:hypothetical protein
VVGAGLGKAKAILTQTPEEKLVKQLKLEKVPAVIDNLKVQIQKPETGLIEKAVS